MSTPPLIHVGYHKTGSTWLQKVLFDHPRSSLRSIGKEGRDSPVRSLVSVPPLQFDADAMKALLTPLTAEIARSGKVPVVSFERLSGHPASGGYDSKEIAQRLAMVFPGGRILIVIREQQDIIASAYKQYVRAGGALPLRWFLDPRMSLNTPRVPQFDFRFYEYHHLIRFYQTLFGEKQVLVLAQEQLRRDPAAFAAVVARFAGAPMSPDDLAALPLGSSLNPALSPITIGILRRLNGFGVRGEYNQHPLVDLPGASGLRKALQSLDRHLHGPLLRPVQKHLRHRLEVEVSKRVGLRYASSNRITEQMTGLDLGALDWPVEGSPAA